MYDPDHRKRLAEGNIGVVQGAKSSNLCSLDVDSDDEAEEFINLNPQISETLITKGNRGCNLWWFMQRPYPPLKKLKRQDKSWGEWRSDGAQTIIHSIHPTGIAYRTLNRVTPLTLRMEQIRWPEGVAPPFSEVPAGCTELTEQTETTEDHRSGNHEQLTSSLFHSLAEVAEAAIPKIPHENHGCLFTLARALLSFEKWRGRKCSAEEMKESFELWFRKAKPYLRPDQSYDEYYFEFLAARERARIPFGCGVMEEAWRLTIDQPLPPEAEAMRERSTKQLVGLCYCSASAENAGLKIELTH